MPRRTYPGPDHFDLIPVLEDLPDQHGRVWFAPRALSDQLGRFEPRYQLPSCDSAFLAPLVGMPGDEKPIVHHRRANLLKELAHWHIIVPLCCKRKSGKLPSDGSQRRVLSY